VEECGAQDKLLSPGLPVIGLRVRPFQGLVSRADMIPRASLRFALGDPILPLRGGGRNLSHTQECGRQKVRLASDGAACFNRSSRI